MEEEMNLPEDKLAVYPEMKYASEREFKISEILSLALRVFGKRPGVFLLCALMFAFPVSTVLAYVQSLVPDLSVITDPMEYLMAYVREMLPVILWNLGLSFFAMLGTLTVILVTYSELYGNGRMPFGMAFYRAFKRFPAAASAYLVLLLNLVACVILSSAVGALLPILSFLVLPFLITYAVYFALMRESTAVVAVHTGLGLWRNTACVTMIFRDRLGRVFGRYLLLGLIALLPKVLLTLIASFGLELIGNQTVFIIASGAVDGLLSVFTFFLSACVTVMVNNMGDLIHKETAKLENTEKNC